MNTTLRDAERRDVPGMHAVRLAVRENVLVSRVLTEADYLHVIETAGRGWVVEAGSEIVAFSAGTAADGNLWALFVHPDHERRGFGRELHDTAVAWLWTQPLERLWLTTSANTRAQRFYERAGWRPAGRLDSGDIRYELLR